MIEPFDVFSVFEYTYIAAVVLCIEFIKLYFRASGTWSKTLLTLGVALGMAAVFILFHHFWGEEANNLIYAQKLLVSFFGVTALYSVIVKPLLDKLKR